MPQSSTTSQNKPKSQNKNRLLMVSTTLMALYLAYKMIKKSDKNKETNMEINVPDLGVDSAEVSEIMVKVGDVINVDDNIVLLESDKASVEVPSPKAGKITAISINVGDKVKEGDVILSLDSDDRADTAQPAVKEETPATSEPTQTTEPVKTDTAPTAQPTNQASEQTYPLPDLGVDSAEISEWLVAVGDSVTEEQPLVLVESDKASVEVPAPVSGKIVKFLVNAGDTISNGQNFVVIASASGATTDTTATSAPVANQAEPTANVQPIAQTSQPAGKQTFALPDLGVDSADISEWLVSVGDSVAEEQPLVLVESDKASVEVPAPATGKIVELLVKAGDTVSNGQNFVVIETQGATQSSSATVSTATAPTAIASETPKAQSSQPQTQAQTPVNSATAQTANPSATLSESQINAKHADVYAGPAVRKLTRQLGVDISEVKGTGDKGRIIKEDIFAYVKNRMQAQPTAQTSQAVTGGAVGSGLPPLPDMSKVELWGEIERQDLSKLQKVSIPQLNYNTYLPQVTQFDLADITDTEAMRSDIKEEMKKQGVSLTILAFIMKAVAYALGEYPKFNSHLSDDNTQILVRKSVHMGFAVATPTGLTVPVIKDVQTKGIKQIAKEIGEMATKARDGKLTPKDMTGASFTISSQGNLGGTYFTPLVTWPQVAILGVSEASMQPRWNGKEFEPRLMLPLSLSYDHRVINGADAAVFTRYIAKLLADPRRILL